MLITPANKDMTTIIKGDFNVTKIDWYVPGTLSNHTTADNKFISIAFLKKQLNASC